MPLDINHLLTELTLEEKASLTSGSSTCFPTASAVASAWNPELLRRIGQALAQEARACHLSVILGPGVNMKRSPLCGRNFEYFAEDPFLAGEPAVGIVNGIQSRGVGTAAESVVLLENDGLLPLPAAASIAVVGEFARSPRFQGAGSSQVNPTRVDALLDELRAVHGDVPFAAGYGIGTTDDDAVLVAEAEAEQVAGAADTVVMMIGLPGANESEGFDRTHLDLPANQLTALAAVAAVNPNVVVAGGAIADVLTGVVNPSGRIAESIPHRLEDNSSYLNFPGDSQVVRYGEGLFIGYRGYDKARLDVAFPFGFGLSYTSFALSDLQVTTTGSAAEGDLAASVAVTVTNTGSVDGADVVQVYVQDVESTVTRPVRELEGFTKVFLAAGSSATVTVELDQRAFSFWSTKLGRWAVEAGDFVLAVGSSSRDLPLQETVTVEAPSLAVPLSRDSTLQEWMSDPTGRQLIEREVAAGQPAAAMDGELLAVIGNMPMSTLASFGGMSLDHDALDRVTDARQQAGQAS